MIIKQSEKFSKPANGFRMLTFNNPGMKSAGACVWRIPPGICVLVALLAPAGLIGQQTLDSVLRANSFPFSFDEQLSGSGADHLYSSMPDVQFIALGE